MNQSPLQLEHYEFSKILVEINAGYVGHATEAMYPAFDPSCIEFQSAVKHKVLQEAEGEFRCAINLALRGVPVGDDKFPYSFEVVINGVVNGSALPEGKREALTVVNGASLLYGACRDVLLATSLRMGHGPIMLPSVRLTQLIEKFASPSQSSPAETAGEFPKKRAPRRIK